MIGTRAIVAAPCRFLFLRQSRWEGRHGDERRVATAAVAGRRTTDDLFIPEFGKEQTDHDVEEAVFDAETWNSAVYGVEPVPDGCWVERVEGTIPPELHGTYFKNGPGDGNFLNEPVEYPWDANGIMVSLAIKDGKAYFRSRFVETKHSMLEERAGMRLFKGGFGTVPKNGVAPNLLLTVRDANSGKPVVAKGKLYAPYDAAPASELDPFTLKTVYPRLPAGFVEAVVFDAVSTLLDSVLSPQRKDSIVGVSIYDSSAGGANAGSDANWSPMKIGPFGDNAYDGRRKVTICHGYTPKPKLSKSGLVTDVRFFEFDENLDSCTEQSYETDGLLMAHGLAVSENYYVISKSPMKVNMENLLNPMSGVSQCIEIDEHGTQEFHLVPRPGTDSKWKGKRPLVFKSKDASFIFHFVNAFEVDDKIVIDAIHYPKYPSFRSDKESVRSYKTQSSSDKTDMRWRRSVCSLDGEMETRDISTRAVELPSINPRFVGRPYQFAYLTVGLDPFGQMLPQALGKVDLKSGDLEVWTKGPQYSVGEPTFVPRTQDLDGDEGDGWILSLCYDGKTRKSEFVIFDAKNIRGGPIATLYLNHSTGNGFHATWTNTYYGPIL